MTPELQGSAEAVGNLERVVAKARPLQRVWVGADNLRALLASHATLTAENTALKMDNASARAGLSGTAASLFKAEAENEALRGKVGELERQLTDYLNEDTRDLHLATTRAEEAEAQLATARREARQEAAALIRGGVFKEQYRTWPFWSGNRGRDSELVRFADAAAGSLLAEKEPGT